jgi:hypothetical protein
MKNLNFTFFSIALLLTLTLGACKKSEIKETSLQLAVTTPATLTEAKIKSATITFKESNSNATFSSSSLVNNQLNINLPEGAYDVSLQGEIEHVVNGEKITSIIRGTKQGVIINGNNFELDLSTFIYKGEENFVIKEIFFAGTETPQGKVYNGDKYFIIHNNSDKVLYADSLMIAESEYLTTTKRVYTPDVMATDFTSRSIVMVPGNGKTYPIQPGKSFIVANNAINHLEYNANSLNLTNADFELTLLSSINVDNPQVKDLENIVGTMTMHNRGFKAYVIAKMKGTKAEFLTNQVYEFTYVNSANNITKVSGAYKIPNSWVLDAVNLSVAAEFNWLVTSPQLDMGWSFCGKVDSDKTRFGKSVVRKESNVVNGRVILQDTNNSTDDFVAEAKPTLFK